MSLSFDQIDDAVIATQELLAKRGAFVNLQTDTMNHVAVGEIWGKRKYKFAGGHPWTIQVQTDHNHSAKSTGLFEEDSTLLTDTLIEGTIPIRFANAHYAYDVRMPLFQAGGHQIVDFVESKYTEMMVSFYEYLEAVLWGKPENSADTKTPFGVAYWVTRNATEGFNGGNPVGFTSGKAGIDADVYRRWKNWTNTYTSVTGPDLIRSMRRMHRKTKFRSPVSHALPDMGSMANGIYLNDTTIGLAEELLESNNMNLGNDLASKDGRSVFKSTPLTYVPYLDNDSTDPVYMLDWKKMGVGVMAGWENKLSKPEKLPYRHTGRRVDLDVSLNMVCSDPRFQGVIYKA